MIVTRGLGRDTTQQTYIVSTGLGKYAIIVDGEGNIRVVRIVTSVDSIRIQSEVTEAI